VFLNEEGGGREAKWGGGEGGGGGGGGGRGEGVAYIQIFVLPFQLYYLVL